MKYSNSIEYSISTKADLSGINKLQSELLKVSQTLDKIQEKQRGSGDVFLSRDIDESKAKILDLQKALASAFNPKLGLLDGTKFQAALKQSNLDVRSIQTSLASAGATGQKAFNGLVGELGRVNTGIKTSSSALDKMANTFANTVR